MYQIMDRDVRVGLTVDLALNRYEQDAATALAIAADQDALASRLMDCADARLSLARNAYGAHPPTMLNQSARALYLIECAGKAKRQASYMLSCAVTFERALGQPEGSAQHQAACAAWSDLMAEGIFSPAMYEGMEDAMDDLARSARL